MRSNRCADRVETRPTRPWSQGSLRRRGRGAHRELVKPLSFRVFSASASAIVFCHPSVAHGLALGSIGLNLRAVKHHMTKLHQARFQDLGKKTAPGFEVSFAEFSNPVMVGVPVCRAYID